MLSLSRVLAVGFLLALPAVGAAGDKKPQQLSEADLVKLIELQVEDHCIVRRLDLAGGPGFKVDSAVVERLRKAGASEAVLAALKGEKSPPPPEGVLATEKHKSGLLVDVTRIKRTSDGFLSINWRYRNPTDKDVLLFDYTPIGVNGTNHGWGMLKSLYFVDPKTAKKHFIVHDTNNELLANGFATLTTTVKAHGEEAFWAKFPPPADGSKFITLYLQDTPPFEDLQVPPPSK
jgi:hypothetical protein